MGRLKPRVHTCFLGLLHNNMKQYCPGSKWCKCILSAGVIVSAVLIGGLLACKGEGGMPPRLTLMFLQGHSARVRQVTTKWIAPQRAGLQSHCQVNTEIFCLRLPSLVKCLYLLLHLESPKTPPLHISL